MKCVTLTTGSAISGERASWAYVLRYGSDFREDAGGTNVGNTLRYKIRSSEDTKSRVSNALLRMEMLAVIEGLQRLRMPCGVLVMSQNFWLLDDICLEGGPRSYTRKLKQITYPIKNAELWKRLDVAAEKHFMDTRWINFMSIYADKERCDVLARTQATCLGTGLEAVTFFRDVFLRGVPEGDLGTARAVRP